METKAYLNRVEGKDARSGRPPWNSAPTQSVQNPKFESILTKY